MSSTLPHPLDILLFLGGTARYQKFHANTNEHAFESCVDLHADSLSMHLKPSASPQNGVAVTIPHLGLQYTEARRSQYANLYDHISPVSTPVRVRVWRVPNARLFPAPFS